jgi:hypothetical protein
MVTKKSWQGSRGGHGSRSYQLSFVKKLLGRLNGAAVKRGDLGPNYMPRNGPISPPNGQISKFSKNKILVARAKKLEQGNILSQPAPFLFIFAARSPPFSGVSPRARSS